MQLGDRIDERYRLSRLLGEGGMAAVYLAHDERLEREVAIKLLFSGSGKPDKDLAESFLREARIAGSIRHPNVVQVIDFGTHDGSVPYMVMEALDGEAMADRYSRGYRFQLAEVVSIALGSLEGLAAVHAAGIVHRDVKPENIFLARTPRGELPKLLDFGISRAADKSSGLRSAVTTREGRLIGTPEYMSPEQARGVAQVDLRTDIYSLGVVMYEALYGRPPFESENEGDLTVLVIAGNAPPLSALMPEVGEPISKVVAQAMARDREQRYPSALAMHAALEAALATTLELGSPNVLPAIATTSRAQSASERTIRRASTELAGTLGEPASSTTRPTPRAFWIAGAALVLGLALGSYVWLSSDKPESDGPRYIVVQGAHEPEARRPSETVANAPAPTPAKAEPAPTVPAEPQTVPAQPQPARPAVRKPIAIPKPAADLPEPDHGLTLTRAFERQKAAVVQCLVEHPDALPEHGELAVRISLDSEGRVVQAGVTPDGLAQTQTGACVTNATKAMEFGKQAGPVVFRVPLTTRRH